MSTGFLKKACRRCISFTRGCCEFALIDGWKIFVFPEEAKRIAAYTGREVSKFLDSSPLTESQLDYIAENSDEDPMWSRLFSLWKEPTGFKIKCPFIQKGGCSLPYDIKPFICQAFPLDFNITESTIRFRDDNECLVSQVVDSMDKVTACFNDHCDPLNKRFIVFRNDFIKLLDVLENQSAYQ